MEDIGNHALGFHVLAHGRGRFVACCTCGWLGDPVVTAGLAGSTWDRHVLTDHSAAVHA